MSKLIYTPKALDDLQGIKTYVSRQFGADRAKIGVRTVHGTVRVIRILNEKQDFLQILFGISSISEEGEDYWGD